MKLEKQNFPTQKGQITWVTLTNDNGAQLMLSSLGAGIVAVKLPQTDGSLLDVVIGYAKAEDYFADGPCAGKTPGRYANRIAKGHIEIDGQSFELPINNGPNHLHGGPEGFQNQIWECTTEGDNMVVFTHHSANGDSGYPGNLDAEVVYTWDNDNTVTIAYRATTDAPTVVNLTNHTYFNLNGHGSGTVLQHALQMNCSTYLPTDATQIPLGQPAEVAGTPMDFTQPHTIGERINDEFEALKFGKGYDHCWMIDNYDGTLREAAVLTGDRTGRKVTIYTDQPAAQVYTGNWLNGCPAGKDGATYHDYDAVAIECQGCPDAPNNPAVPSQRLNPGEIYKRTIKFHFD